MRNDEKNGNGMAPPGDRPVFDERLHRYHDGELTPEERTALEASLDPEARLKLEALDEIGVLLRDVSDAETEGFDAWAGVKTKIDDEKQRDERLHRYHDGEMAAAERAAFEATLDSEARLKLEALDEIGALLRGSSEAATEGFDAWAGVQQKIAAAEQAKVVSLATHRKRRRGAIFAGISTVAAAAAALLSFLQPWQTAEAITNNCEITSVEATGADVTVVKIPDDGKNDSTTVVWLHETE